MSVMVKWKLENSRYETMLRVKVDEKRRKG